MEVVTVGLVIALIWKIVDVLKYAVAAEWVPLRTQLVVWVAAIGVVLLAAQADLTEGLQLIGGVALGNLNVWSLILAGLLIGSGASGTVDFKKALDNTDSAGVPPLATRFAIDRAGRARPG